MTEGPAQSKPGIDKVTRRIRILKAACDCAEQVNFFSNEDRREILHEVQKILGCGEKTE